MLTPVSLVSFAGSLRQQSVNQGLLRAAQELLPQEVRMEILALDALPYYNQDLEADEPTSIHSFKEQIRHADAVLIATPEFNGSIPGVLKNALDWLSRPPGASVMAGKLTAIIGAGGGGGTANAQMHLRQILTRFQVAVLDQPQVHIARSWEKFDTHGNLQDEASREHLLRLLTALLEAVQARRTEVHQEDSNRAPGHAKKEGMRRTMPIEKRSKRFYASGTHHSHLYLAPGATLPGGDLRAHC